MSSVYISKSGVVEHDAGFPGVLADHLPGSYSRHQSGFPHSLIGICVLIAKSIHRMKRATLCRHVMTHQG